MKWTHEETAVEFAGVLGFSFILSIICLIDTTSFCCSLSFVLVSFVLLVLLCALQCTCSRPKSALLCVGKCTCL